MIGAGISFVVGSAKGRRGQLQMPGALEASESGVQGCLFRSRAQNSSQVMIITAVEVQVDSSIQGRRYSTCSDLPRVSSTQHSTTIQFSSAS